MGNYPACLQRYKITEQLILMQSAVNNVTAVTEIDAVFLFIVRDFPILSATVAYR